MNLLSKLVFVSVLFVQSLVLYADAIDLINSYKQERMLGDLDVIKNTFQTGYAPSSWKLAYAGWNLQTEIDLAKEKVKSDKTLSTKDFQFILKDLFNSVRDYHVTIEFYSTSSASLPFQIRHVKNKYYFTHIEQDQMNVNDPFPFAVGDELVLFDGVPTNEVVEEFIRYEIGNNHQETDHALAEIYLTKRLGSLGHHVPSGMVILTGYKTDTNELIEHALSWNYKEEYVSDAFKVTTKKMMDSAISASKGKSSIIARNQILQKQFAWPNLTSFEATWSSKQADRIIGGKKSFVPVLGEILWKTPEKSEFFAYLFDLPNGKRAGYVRIPTYSLNRIELAADEFAEIIELFQAETDVIVIDQVNNPGGSVLYLYALTSMLTDKPLELPMHRQMLTQEDVYAAASELNLFGNIESDEEALEFLGDTLEGMTPTYEIAQAFYKYFQFILDEWNAGQQLTQYCYLYGIGPLQPHPKVQFNKPILVLVNGLDFSCADFFPAILQDNQRAVIMGTRTAGAGGYVSRTSFPNLSGISGISYTGSIAARPGNRLIENSGVVPDIMYESTEYDMQHNHAEYALTIIETLQQLAF